MTVAELTTPSKSATVSLASGTLWRQTCRNLPGARCAMRWCWSRRIARSFQ